MIAIRPGTADDLPEIAAIQGQSKEASQWRPAEYLRYTLRVAEHDGRPSGFVVTREVAAGEYEILNLVVRTGLRRRGLARALMRAVLTGSPGVHYLEVRESNQVARLFYRNLGFEEVGVRRDYYTDPEEPAVVMRICS